MKKSPLEKSQLLHKKTLFENERARFEDNLGRKALALRHHLERLEAKTEASCIKAKESKEWLLEKQKEEERLASEMAKDKNSCLREMKLREYIQNSEELKDLQKKIQIAYMQRDIAAQLVEKRVQKLKEKCQEKEEQKIYLEHGSLNDQIEKRRQEEMEQKKLQYKEELKLQLAAHKQKQELEHQMQIVERAIFEEQMRSALEEKQKEEENKALARKKIKEDTEEMLRAKSLLKQIEKEYDELEERKINEYLKEKTKQEKVLLEENRRKEELRKSLQQTCIHKIQESEGEQKERERIRQILQDEEERKKEEEKRKREIRDRHHKLLEFKEITARQIQLRMEAIGKEREADIQFSRKVLEDNEKAIKQEQEHLMKKKLENIQHGKILKQIIQDQNIKKFRELEAEYIDHLRELEEIKKRQHLLAEGRVQILKEHAKHLIGFLPKGAIMESDIPYLDPEVQKYYKKT